MEENDFEKKTDKNLIPLVIILGIIIIALIVFIFVKYFNGTSIIGSNKNNTNLAELKIEIEESSLISSDSSKVLLVKIKNVSGIDLTCVTPILVVYDSNNIPFVYKGNVMSDYSDYILYLSNNGFEYVGFDLKDFINNTENLPEGNDLYNNIVNKNFDIKLVKDVDELYWYDEDDINDAIKSKKIIESIDLDYSIEEDTDSTSESNKYMKVSGHNNYSEDVRISIVVLYYKDGEIVYASDDYTYVDSSSDFEEEIELKTSYSLQDCTYDVFIYEAKVDNSSSYSSTNTYNYDYNDYYDEDNDYDEDDDEDYDYYNELYDELSNELYNSFYNEVNT